MSTAASGWWVSRAFWMPTLLIAVASPLAADVLVLTQGGRMEVASYEVRGTVVVFETADGRTFSLAIDEVDLAATERANTPSSASGEVPGPTTASSEAPREARTGSSPAGATPPVRTTTAPTGSGLHRRSYRPLQITEEDYNRLVCYARQPRHESPGRPGRVGFTGACAALPTTTTSEILPLIEKTCALQGCGRINRDLPAAVLIGLSASPNRSIFLVAPERSGVDFDPLGDIMPRADRFTAVSITDFSEGLIGSVELTVSERGRAVYRDSHTESDPTRPQGLTGEDRRVAVMVTEFDIPHTPASLSIEFVETDLVTLQRRSKAANFAVPAYHAVNLDLGFLIPFNTVQVDRITLWDFTGESIQRLKEDLIDEDPDVDLEEEFPGNADPNFSTDQRRVVEEKARTYAYLTGTLNMTGLRQKALEGEIGFLRPLAGHRVGRTAIKLLWPDLVLGVGVPAVQSRFFKDNSFFLGAGWRLGTNKVRLTWGYQFTTLEVLRAPYIGGDFVPNDLPESAVIEQKRFHSMFFGVSFSLVSFGRDSL